MKKLKKYLFVLLSFVLILNSQNVVHAAEFSNTNNGTYSVNASLSCYVNAMGGVEFGGPLLKGAEITVNSGKAVMKLTFGKSAVTIYGITCDTFIDANPSGSANGQGVVAGTIGYYNKNGNLSTSDVTTTLSADKALNPANEAVPYVTSMSFPLDQVSSTYQLTLYVNSNVMGSQFGAGGSPATLKVEWSNVPGIEVENSNSSSNQGTSGSAGTSGNSSATGNINVNGNSSTVESTTGSVNKGETVDTTSNVSTSENSAGNNVPTEDVTTAKGAETAETDDSKSVATVEKDGLNIYYASDENNATKDVEATSDSITDKIILGLIVVIVAVAVGAESVVLKKKLKKKLKKEDVI